VFLPPHWGPVLGQMVPVHTHEQRNPLGPLGLRSILNPTSGETDCSPYSGAVGGWV
jgi:hypothetical protein